jgi:molybdenum cofactor cytidylyltransferase
MKLSAIILAAGYSRRFGSNKLLALYHGMPLLHHVISQCHASLVDELLVVYRDPQVLDVVQKFPVRPLYNGNAHEGMSASVKLGVSNISTCASGCMIVMGDQPLFLTSDFNRLIHAFKKNPIIVAASTDGKRSTPVIFPKKYFEELLNSTGDAGGRHIIEREPSLFVPYPPSKIWDVDTWDDIEVIQQSNKEE